MPQKPIIRKPPPILSADSLAGFWPRAGAFVIDYLALAAIGWALVSAFFDSLAALGPAAAIIGYAAAALFFAFFESGLGGGQSPGKRLIGIRAARADGGMLAPRRALLRAAIKAAPFYFPAQFVAQDPFSQWRWHCALFGLFVALAYPVAGRGGQGRTSRQSFHDYLTGAHVIRAPRPEPDENEREQAMRAFAPLADAPPPPAIAVAIGHESAARALFAGGCFGDCGRVDRGFFDFVERRSLARDAGRIRAPFARSRFANRRSRRIAAGFGGERGGFGGDI